MNTLPAGRLRSVFAAFIFAAVAMLLLVAGSAQAASGTFSSATAITIPSAAPGTTSGNATPYPAGISVTGLGGTITDVNVKLENIGHAHPDDLDIIVVSPRGDNTVEISSSACWTAAIPSTLNCSLDLRRLRRQGLWPPSPRPS